MKRKPVGLRRAKKIFARRSLRSQIRDRQTTAKRVVLPLSKDSAKWAEHPDRYDMKFVDTKSIVPMYLVGGARMEKIHVKPFANRPRTKRDVEATKRSILGAYGPVLDSLVKTSKSTRRLQKRASIRVHYRKSKKSRSGFDIFVSPKKGRRFYLPHPVFIESRD